MSIAGYGCLRHGITNCYKCLKLDRPQWCHRHETYVRNGGCPDCRIEELKAERENLTNAAEKLRAGMDVTLGGDIAKSIVRDWLDSHLPTPPEDNTITGATVPGSRKP